jgi:hypothetical protein
VYVQGIVDNFTQQGYTMSDPIMSPDERSMQRIIQILEQIEHNTKMIKLILLLPLIIGTFLFFAFAGEIVIFE